MKTYCELCGGEIYEPEDGMLIQIHSVGPRSDVHKACVQDAASRLQIAATTLAEDLPLEEEA